MKKHYKKKLVDKKPWEVGVGSCYRAYKGVVGSLCVWWPRENHISLSFSCYVELGASWHVKWLATMI